MNSSNWKIRSTVNHNRCKGRADRGRRRRPEARVLWCRRRATCGTSHKEEEEEDILDKAFDVRATSRLGCQSTVQKDGVVEVEITRESLEAYENEHPEARGKYTKRAG